MYQVSLPAGSVVARVYTRSLGRRRRAAIMTGRPDDLDEVVIVCLYLMLLQERRGVLGGALGEYDRYFALEKIKLTEGLGESIVTMVTISLAPVGFLRF